jgi:hypothetical protein
VRGGEDAVKMRHGFVPDFWQMIADRYRVDRKRLRAEGKGKAISTQQSCQNKGAALGSAF